MNASVRREGSGVCLGRLASPARRAVGSFRRRAIRRALLTGVAFASPVLVAAAPPSAPVPPMLPVAEKPANSGLFSKPIKKSPSAAQTASSGTASAASADAPTTSATPTAAAAKAGDPSAGDAKPAAAWNPLASLGSWSPSRSLSALVPVRTAAAPGPATPDAAASVAKPAEPATKGRQPAAAPASAKTVVVSAPAAAGAGRFDPDLGPAGHFVSDAAAPTPPGRPGPEDDTAFLASAPVFPAAPGTEEATPAAADAPVSLVSWLSKSYSDYVASAGPDDAAADCRPVCVTDRCCPTWQVQVDALFLWQGNIPGRSLYVDSATQQTVLDASQLQNRAAIAPRYGIIYNRDDCRAFELNYFQVWGFNAVANVGSPTAPVLNSAGDGAFAIDNALGLSYDSIGYARATSSAHITSFEGNLRLRECDGVIQWISGFRWLEWGQGLSLQDVAYSGGVPAGSDAIDITTLNSLYGWQWGGDMTLWNAGRWVRINGVGKAGIYYNHQALQNTSYSLNGDPAQTFADSKDAVSFVGETGINASWALTNWLSWRAGYSCFWLGGMAVPARQLALTDVNNGTTSVNTTGSVFLHGVTTGLEARW